MALKDTMLLAISEHGVNVANMSDTSTEHIHNTYDMIMTRPTTDMCTTSDITAHIRSCMLHESCDPCGESPKGQEGA